MTIIPIQTPQPDYARELTEAGVFARQAISKATHLAYSQDLSDFKGYCTDRNLCQLPAGPETIAAYLASLSSRLKISSIRRRLVAISQDHKRYGVSSPTAHPMVRAVLKGIARDAGVQFRSRTTKKTALTADRLRRLVGAIGTTPLRAKRDRAIVLLGWSAALRRCELATLDVDDLAFDSRGVTVCLRASKTDPYGASFSIDLPHIEEDLDMCPVAALRAWLGAAALTSGPLFRSFGRGDALKANRIAPIDVARCIQRAAAAAELAGDYSGHSLRRGFATTAIASGATTLDAMGRTRHKSRVVFQGYVDEALLFVGNPLPRMLRATGATD